MSTPVPVRLLILEDNPVDVELLLHDLRRAGFELEYELVASEGDYSAKLNESFELILADYSLPHFDAPAALRLLQQRHLDIPFIIVSGTVGEEQAVALIKQGATDYLLKDRLGRLGIAVTQALEAKRLRDEQQQSQVALRASEERFRALVQHSTDVITILAADMTVLYESPSLEKVMGYRPEAVQGLNITDVIHPDDLPLIVERMSTILEQPATTFSVEVRLRHADGSWRLQEAAVTNLLDHPAIHGIVVNSRDITERKQTEAQLATQAKLLDQLSDSIIKLDIHGIIEFWNRGSERLYGWSAEEVTGKLLADVIQTQVVNDTMENAVRRVLDTGGWNGEYVQTRKDGTSLPVLNATTLLRDGHGNPVGYVGINRDITERKRATEAILESEARFRAVFEHSPLGKSLTAPNGKLLQVNQAFAALLGYSIDEMQQIDFTQITYPQDVAESRECVRRLLANEQRQYRMEKRYVHKNGRLIWTDVNTALLRDATGSPLYFMTSVADITEHKRAEQALHQYNRRIEILHSIDRGILTAQSPQKIAEMIAQSLTELIHYDAIRIIGISSSENPLPYLADYPPASQSSQDLLRQAIDQYGLPESFQRGEALLIDDVQTHADLWLGFEEVLTAKGARSWIIVPLIVGERLVGIVAIGSLQPLAFTSEHADIAREVADQLAIALHKNHLDEQIQAHTRQLEARVTERTEQLRTAKERTEAILMSASDAMIVASLDGSIEQVNTAFMALFGYTLEQGRALPLFSLLDAVSADTVRRTLDEIGAGGQAQRLELVGLRQDGTLFEAEAAFSRVEDGYSTTLICSLRDITTRKRAEQDLRTALAKEKELNELKSRFVSMVAHDFRSPLASIQSSSDLLNNYGDRMIAEKKQHHFKRISSQIKNLTGILEDTLTISKTEAIGVSLHPLSTDFVPFCQAIIDDMQLIDATRPIRFTVNGEVGKVEIDRDQLRRVLVNLLSNAAKYSPEGSAIEFNVQSGNEQVILRIQDEGIGIPEADQSHLFEVFHRAGNVGDIPGTGLGLVIVKRAVEAHGGSITVESQVDLGTTFILALPVTQAKSTRHE